MSFVVPALNVLHTFIFIAAEGEEEFDPNKVTSGPAGFFATAAMAIAVIMLGVLLVRRLRRNQYRSEARAVIAEELAANDVAEASAEVTNSTEAVDSANAVDSAESADLTEDAKSTDGKPADKEGGEG